MAGRIERIHVKPWMPGERGLPTVARSRVTVRGAGLEGDFNRHRMERRVGDPCRNLAVLSYVGDERVVELMRALLDRRGWYARVLEAGELAVGDRIQPLERRV